MQQLWLLVVTPMRALVRVEGTNSGPDFLAPQNGANTKTNYMCFCKSSYAFTSPLSCPLSAAIEQEKAA